MKRYRTRLVVIFIVGAIFGFAVMRFMLFTGNEETVTVSEMFGMTYSDSDRIRAVKLINDATDMTIYMDQKTVVIPKDIIRRAEYIQEAVLWKGAFPGRISNIDTSGEEKFLEVQVSCYAHFFSIEGVPGYFEVNEKDFDAWDEALGLNIETE